MQNGAGLEVTGDKSAFARCSGYRDPHNGQQTGQRQKLPDMNQLSFSSSADSFHHFNGHAIYGTGCNIVHRPFPVLIVLSFVSFKKRMVRDAQCGLDQPGFLRSGSDITINGAKWMNEIPLSGSATIRCVTLKKPFSARTRSLGQISSLRNSSGLAQTVPGWRIVSAASGSFFSTIRTAPYKG